MKTEEKTLGEFGFEEASTSFFNETSPAVTTDEIVAEVISDNVIADGEEKPAKLDEEKEPVFSFETDVNVDVEEIENEEDDSKPASTDNGAKFEGKVALEYLKSKGLVDYELAEGEELTDELANEILEDSREDAILNAADEKIKALPTGLKQMIKIALEGGDFTGMFAQLANQAKKGITVDTDLAVEANQILVLQHDLEGQGYDQEYIDTHIEVLKDTGKLKLVSEKLKNKIIAEQEKVNEQEVAKATQQRQNNIENQRRYKTEASDYIKSVDNIKGIVINKKDKQELPAYMSDMNVKMADGRLVTKYQEELFSIFADKEKNTLLAKLIKTNFDFTSITNKTITDYSRSIKDEIQNNKNKTTVTESRGSSRRPNKSLADMLD